MGDPASSPATAAFLSDPRAQSFRNTAAALRGSAADARAKAEAARAQSLEYARSGDTALMLRCARTGSLLERDARNGHRAAAHFEQGATACRSWDAEAEAVWEAERQRILAGVHANGRAHARNVVRITDVAGSHGRSRGVRPPHRRHRGSRARRRSRAGRSSRATRAGPSDDSDPEPDHAGRIRRPWRGVVSP